MTDEEYWYTADDGRKVCVKPGETPIEAYKRMYGDPEFDGTDDIEIDVETEDENTKYDTLYYYKETWMSPGRIIDESEIGEHDNVHEITITNEIQDVLNDALNDPRLKDNNIRGIMYTVDDRLKVCCAGIMDLSERILVREHFRKQVLEKAKIYANEFLEKLPKTTRTGREQCAIDTNSAGYKESHNARYGSKEYDYYTSNCQRCIVAYEMRRRGYDVEANKYIGRTDRIYNEALSLQTAFLGFDSLSHTKYYDKQPNGEKYPSRAALIKAMEKDMVAEGEGARFAVTWKWKNSSWGHTINAEVVDGKVIFIDAQCNETHIVKDIIDRKDLRATTLKFDRIDNLQLSNRLEDIVKWKK